MLLAKENALNLSVCWMIDDMELSKQSHFPTFGRCLARTPIMDQIITADSIYKNQIAALIQLIIV